MLSARKLLDSVRMEKYASVYFLLVSTLTLWGILSLYNIYTGTFYAVYVDGLEIGLLAEEEELPEVLEDLRNKAVAYYGLPVVTVEGYPGEGISPFCRS